MNGPDYTVKRSRSLKQRFQRLVQIWVWGMDIHPSAWIATTALIDRTWPKGVHIEAGCYIDEEVVLLAHDLTRGIYVDTRIGEGSYIGARAIIMPGVTVGKGCIIRPGTLVSKDVPDGAVMAGNPAKIEVG